MMPCKPAKNKGTKRQFRFEILHFHHKSIKNIANHRNYWGFSLKKSATIRFNSKVIRNFVRVVFNRTAPICTFLYRFYS